MAGVYYVPSSMGSKVAAERLPLGASWMSCIAAKDLRGRRRNDFFEVRRKRDTEDSGTSCMETENTREAGRGSPG